MTNISPNCFAPRVSSTAIIISLTFTYTPFRSDHETVFGGRLVQLQILMVPTNGPMLANDNSMQLV